MSRRGAQRLTTLGLALSTLALSGVGCHPALEADSARDAEALAPEIVCPSATQWDGEACVWRYVITDVRCPAMTVWDGAHCVGTHVACPEGAAWDSTRCVPIGEPPSATDAVASDETVVTPSATMYDDPPAPKKKAPPDAFTYR